MSALPMIKKMEAPSKKTKMYKRNQRKMKMKVQNQTNLVSPKLYRKMGKEPLQKLTLMMWMKMVEKAMKQNLKTHQRMLKKIQR